MVKSLSVVLLFVIYCLLNIYKGILMSALPMAAHCQHTWKCFTLYAQLYCSTTYKTLLTNQYWHCVPRKTSLKLIYYCTLLSMACHFDLISISSTICRLSLIQNISLFGAWCCIHKCFLTSTNKSRLTEIMTQCHNTNQASIALTVIGSTWQVIWN